MTPEHPHNPNPFNNPSFRKEMSEMFDDKLGGVVEVQKEHGKRIRSLERWRWLLAGGIAVLLGLIELAVAATRVH